MKRALIGFVVLSFVYVSIVIGLALTENFTLDMAKLTPIFFVLCCLSLLSFAVRYLRWYWLLLMAGQKISFSGGALAYLTGFAFTLVPGKLGELIRIRYFLRLGVSQDLVISAFVFERLIDLIVILAFAFLLLSNPIALIFSVGFVVLIATVVFILIYSSDIWLLLGRALRYFRLGSVIPGLLIVQSGLQGVARWFNGIGLLAGFVFGIVAWGVLALGFIYLLHGLNISVSFWPALALYPSAMLVGAASLLPGGIVSTEGTIAAQLIAWGVEMHKAILAALIIRIATLWFAMLIGFLSVIQLERKRVTLASI